MANPCCFSCSLCTLDNALYYKLHLAAYSLVLFVAGLSQLMLGAYIIKQFNVKGAMPFGPIAVSPYVVSFPAISVTVGLIQLLNGMWGLVRSAGFGVGGAEDCKFQSTIYLGWFLQFVLQFLVQIGYLPGDALSDAVATLTAYSFGLNLMPAYLDYKCRTIPAKIEPSYYSISPNSQPTDSAGETSQHDVEEAAIAAGETSSDAEENPVDVEA